MSKARNGDGALWFDSKTKKWIVEISLRTGPGGKRRRTRRTFDTQTTAKEARRRLLADRDAGLLTEIRNDTVSVYGLKWVKDVKALQVRPGTASDYEYRLRHEIIPYLGKIKVTELSTHAVENWLATLRRSGKSAATVNGARQVLLALCKHALRNRIIPFNPVELTAPVRRQKEDPTQVKEPWSRDEISLVLSRASDQDSLDVFLHLMLHLGLRSGEALGLRWCDRSGARGWNCLGGFSHIWQSIGGCDHGGIWRFVLYCSRCHLERWNDGSRDDLASGNRCCFGQRLPPANDGRAARDVDPTGEPKCQRKLLEF